MAEKLNIYAGMSKRYDSEMALLDIIADRENHSPQIAEPADIERIRHR